MDSNHDKGLQRALCYHYTIGQLSMFYRESYPLAKKIVCQGKQSRRKTNQTPTRSISS